MVTASAEGCRPSSDGEHMDSFAWLSPAMLETTK